LWLLVAVEVVLIPVAVEVLVASLLEPVCQ
jgi:hypothetical protein